MMFKYKAIKADGTRMEGKIEADNEEEAIDILQDRQLIIISVEQFEEKKVFGSSTTGVYLPPSSFIIRAASGHSSSKGLNM